MKLNLCDKFLFRARKPNVYCNGLAGHEGLCVFPVADADARPQVIRKPDPKQPQQGVVKG